MNEPAADPNSSSDRDTIVVETVAEIQDLTRQSASILAVGSRSKPCLAATDPDTKLFSTSSLSGISEYEPSEFTFTAFAGTTIEEIGAALREKQQYLPFDPLLRREGATLGGTLAAGFSGPGRHRFGGVRDFVLGVEFVAGDGELIHAGGKVVKNAAGFDIPKLLVGSCGRLGAITSLTFKVFPKPTEFHSYSLQCESHSDATSLIAKLARGRWELDAIDYRGEQRTLWIRLGGPKSVCERIVEDIRDSIGQPTLRSMSPEQAKEFWGELTSLAFGGKDPAERRAGPNEPRTRYYTCTVVRRAIRVDLFPLERCGSKRMAVLSQRSSGPTQRLVVGKTT